MKKPPFQFYAFVLLLIVWLTLSISKQLWVTDLTTAQIVIQTPNYLPFVARNDSILGSATPTSNATPSSTQTTTATPTSTQTTTATTTATPTLTATSCDFDSDAAFSYNLQFEDFTCGGEGVAYHDNDISNVGGEYRLGEGVDIAVAVTQGSGNSYYVGWTEINEWLEYKVTITYPSPYYFVFHVSSLEGNGRFHLEIDGVDVTGSITIPNTGGIQSWTSILTPRGTFLDAGEYTFKLVIEEGGGNFDYLRTYPATPTPSSTPES